MNENFKNVRALMRKGIPMYKACKSLGISYSYFSKNLTDQQRHEIKQLKTLMKGAGILRLKRPRNADAGTK